MSEGERRGRLTPGQLIEKTKLIDGAPLADVLLCDRHELAVGLFIHGYTAGDACYKAFVELDDNDGTLQMLARHRLATTRTQPQPSGGEVPVWQEALDEQEAECRLLRDALIRIGRMMPGVLLDDRVSSAFLAALPDELAHYELRRSALDRTGGA